MAFLVFVSRKQNLKFIESVDTVETLQTKKIKQKLLI